MTFLKEIFIYLRNEYCLIDIGLIKKRKVLLPKTIKNNLIMKLIIIIFFSLLSQNVFSQLDTIKTFDYETPNGKIVTIEIDSTKYIPNRNKNFLYNLQNKNIDATIYLKEKSININDTITQFKRARNEGVFTDLGMINGEKTVTMKITRLINDKRYIHFSYMKIILPNELLNFTVAIPENIFTQYEVEFVNYAKSMKIKM
jgi:hypothetical protein